MNSLVMTLKEETRVKYLVVHSQLHSLPTEARNVIVEISV